MRDGRRARLRTACAVLLAHAALALALALSLAPAPAAAQSVSLSMVASSTSVAVGETFSLQIRADVTGASSGELAPPDLSQFDVLSRQLAQPFQFRFAFGGQTQMMQSSSVHTIVLRARAPGTYTIQPATIPVGGRTYRSNPLTITVTGSPTPGQQQPPHNGQQSLPQLQPIDPLQQQLQQQQQPPQPPSPGSGAAVDAANVDPDAFLRTVADKAQPYVGEQVTVTVYLYVRGSLRSVPVASREPSTDGFWVQDLLPPSRTFDSTQQVVQGVPYSVYVLRRFAAFPLRAGALAIGPMSITMQTGSLFDLFGGGPRSMRRDGVPLTLHARALPAAGRPSGNVVVGHIELEARFDRPTAAVGEGVTLRATLRGTGSLADAELPTPSAPGLRFLEPQTHDAIASPNDVVGGTRTIEWLVVPEREGRFSLPPLALATFDPATEQYGRAESAPLTLTVAGGGGGGSSSAPPSDVGDDDGSAQPAPGEGSSQRFGPIRTQSALRRASPPLSSAPWYLVVLALPPIALASVLGARALRSRQAARSAATAPKRAAKHARKRLAGAEAYATAGDARAFYAEIATALKSVVEARLGEPIGGLTHQALRAHLRGRGTPDDLTERVVDELEGCDFARFSAHGVSQEEMGRCLDRARALLTRLDRFSPAAAASAQEEASP